MNSRHVNDIYSSVQLLLLAEAAEDVDHFVGQVVCHHLLVHDNLGEVVAAYPLCCSSVLLAEAKTPMGGKNTLFVNVIKFSLMIRLVI